MPARRGWHVVLLINLTWLGLAALGCLGGTAIAQGPYLHGTAIDVRMLTWDGFWYQGIAQHGYSWNPASGETLGQHQNVAFFPLYALVDWAAMKLAGSARPIVDILPGLGFGLCANAAFYRLAQKFTPRPGFATACFAFWPASCFNAMAYPTGLINLCVIMTLLNHTQNRTWRAAFWCGIGTAAAPTNVFVAAAIGLDATRDWWRSGRNLKTLPRLIAFGLLSLSGLLIFMAYQAVQFGDPLAFVAAQNGFTHSVPVLQHVLLVFDPLWYEIPPQFAWTTIQNAIHHRLLTTPAGREVACAAFQLVLDLLVLSVWISLLAIAWRRHHLGTIALAGWFVTLGYIWFMATTDKGLVNGIRMLYPAIGAFLVLGRLHIRPALGAALLTLLSTLAVVETALVAAGYTVI